MIVLLVIGFVVGGIVSSADADIFGPKTILDSVAKMVDYLGAREGVFYDFNQEEFCNYAGATLYTYQPWNLAVDVGMLNLDGVALTLDWNVGDFIPSEKVPLMNLFKYLYVGGGVGARYIDDNENDEWKPAYGVSAQFKVTW